MIRLQANSNCYHQWQVLPPWITGVSHVHNLHHLCKEVLDRNNVGLVLVWERGDKILRQCAGALQLPAYSKAALYLSHRSRGPSQLTCFSRFISCSISTSLVLALNSLTLEEELLPRPGRSHSSLYSCKCSSSFRKSSMSCGHTNRPCVSSPCTTSPWQQPCLCCASVFWHQCSGSPVEAGQSYNTDTCSPMEAQATQTASVLEVALNSKLHV